jgi:hypothetical protein
VGVIGFVVYRFAATRIGLGLLALYALLGFGGFDHYVVAPMSAHTLTMNATIVFEAITAAAVLAVVVHLLIQRTRVLKAA